MYLVSKKNRIEGILLLLGLVLILVGAFAGPSRTAPFIETYLSSDHKIEAVTLRRLKGLQAITLGSGFFLLSLRLLQTGYVNFYNKIHRTFLPFWFKREKYFLGLVFIIALGALAGFALLVLQNFPNSADEYVYLFQAKTLAEGKLYGPVHPLQPFFKFLYIGDKDGKRVGQYPPGWPLLLSLGVLINLPWIINPLIGALTLIIIYLIGKTVYNPVVAAYAVIIVLGSPFFLFNSASYFSHPTSLLAASVFTLFFVKTYQSEKPIYPFLSGLALGFTFITRHLDPVLFGLPFGFFLLVDVFRKERNALRNLLLLALGPLPCVGLWMLYNYKITGSPFLPVSTYVNSGLTLSVPPVSAASPTRVKHLIDYLANLNLWMYFGSLIFLIPFWISRKGRWDYLFASSVLTVIFGYFLLWKGGGGNQYGPRYYYVALVSLALIIARGIYEMPGLIKDPRPRQLGLAFISATLFMNLFVISAHIRAEHETIYERNDLYRKVQEQGIHHGIVFLRTGTATMPVTDLTRNSPDFQDKVLYARDLKEKNALLMNYYPDRRYYLYEYDQGQKTSRLYEIYNDRGFKLF